ncbi:MAG: transporter [Chitinophagaceae bacterium]|nr:transporter [Chitinophagaceae bacterium]
MMKFISTISLIIISLAANAQEEKIITDRPGFTIDPGTVPKKWIQTETGFSRQTEKLGPGVKDHFMQNPVLLVKYGIVKRVELRALTELGTQQDGSSFGTTTYKGINRVELGAKFNFLDEKGIRPKTSLIVHYHFNHLRTIFHDTLDGGDFRFAMLHTVSKTVLIRYNIGMEWKAFIDHPYYVYSFSPGFNISERWYAYVEAYGYIWKGYYPMNSLGAGLAFYINDNLKVDASAGIGLSKLAPDNFYAFGASFRFRTSKKAE